MIKGLHHIALICSDRERALDFYCGALGFEVMSEHVRPERDDCVIHLSGFGIVIELFVKADCPERLSYPEAYGLRHLALYADDIDAMHAGLISKGYSPEQVREDSFTGERMFFVSDPDGLPIEIHE